MVNFSGSDLAADSRTDSPEAQRLAVDTALSKRDLALDPGGYFIIYLDRAQQTLHAKHFSNAIDERGLAVDPVTGKPIPARGKVDRSPTRTYSGYTAKEVCVAIFETDLPCPVTLLDHAAYLGRELARAEAALSQGEEYVQD